jgi:hypothetical protein
MTGHRRDQCPIELGNPACISQPENLWRRICRMVLGPINKRAAAAVNIVTYNKYGLRIPWEYKSDMIDKAEQGNGRGPSV